MISFLLHSLQAAISGYSLYHASISIPNLQKYEEKSKTAAKYSKLAADQLQRTRSTQAIGTVAVSSFSIPIRAFVNVGKGVFSTSAAVVLAVGLVGSGLAALLLNISAAAMTATASVHMGKFWDDKGKVPLMNNYNEAVDSSKTTRQQLALVGGLWACTSFLAIFGLIW
jgi:hypothetical protein